MKENSRSVVASRTWLSKALLVTQVAVSVVLLIGAGLFVRTLQNLRSVDIGFNAANILMFRVNPALNATRPSGSTQLYQRMQSTLEALPGVRSVSFTRNALLSGSTSITGIYPPGPDRQEGAGHLLHVGGAEVLRHAADPDRDAAATSTSATSPIPKPSAIINETAARKYFAERESDRPARRPDLEDSGKTEIIGIIRDTKYDSVRDAAPPTMYTPIRPGTPVADGDGADRQPSRRA